MGRDDIVVEDLGDGAVLLRSVTPDGTPGLLYTLELDGQCVDVCTGGEELRHVVATFLETRRILKKI